MAPEQRMPPQVDHLRPTGNGVTAGSGVEAKVSRFVNSLTPEEQRAAVPYLEMFIQTVQGPEGSEGVPTERAVSERALFRQAMDAPAR